MSVLGSIALKPEMRVEELQAYMGYAQRYLRVLSPTSLQREQLLNSMLIIAQNKTWRKMLGCDFFINYVTINSRLAEYIVATPDFLSELSAACFLKLKLLCPNLKEKIETALLIIDDSEHTKHINKLLGDEKYMTALVALLKKQHAEMEELVMKRRDVLTLVEMKAQSHFLPSTLGTVESDEEEDVIIVSPRPLEKVRKRYVHVQKSSDDVLLSDSEDSIKYEKPKL